LISKAGLFNGEIVAGSLLEKESRAIAILMLENPDDRTWHQKLFVDNILQKRSQPTIKRMVTLIRKRLSTLNPEAWQIIATGSNEAARHMLLVAAIKHSQLLGDFLIKVIKGNLAVFQNNVTDRDWQKFLEECAAIEPQIKQWSTSTISKLRQVIFRILAEAIILENTRNLKIMPFFINPEVERFLIKNDESYVLKCLQLQ